MEKLLSIIIPSYNMEKYLPKCLGSLIVDDAALLQLLDVIVVNDGSKDRTSEIAHEFEEKYPGVIRVIDKPNGNYGSCVNVGLESAHGVFVKILDADDSFDTKELEAFLLQVRESERGGESVDLFLNDFVWVDEHNDVIKMERQSFEPHLALDVASLSDLGLFYMHAIAYRTTLLREMKYRQIEGISYTDNEWACYPVAFVKRLRYEPFCVYRYLYGRPGQTMDPKIRERDFWMRAIIAKRMATAFEDDVCLDCNASRLYVRNFEAMMVAQLYETAIIQCPTSRLNELLCEFDKELKVGCPQAHAYVMDNSLVSRKIGFNYGKAWAKSLNNLSARLRMFRGYLFVIKKLQQWLRA